MPAPCETLPPTHLQGPEPRPSTCIDCGTRTYCGVAHGAGHDHSEAARACSVIARAAGG